MSRRISLLTQRTALFLLSPSPVPSFLSPPPFLRLSPSLCLSFSNTTYRHSNSPLPSVQRRYPRPRHRQPLHPRNCGHNVSSRTNDQRYMYNSAGYGIGKEYRGPRLCEKRDFFFLPDGYAAPIFELYPRYVRAIVDARPPPLLSTTTTIEIVLRYPWIRMRNARGLERLKFVIAFSYHGEKLYINPAKINFNRFKHSKNRFILMW